MATEESPLSLEDLILSQNKEDAARLGLTWDEYVDLSKTVKPEDTVDEAIPPQNLRKYNA